MKTVNDLRGSEYIYSGHVTERLEALEEEADEMFEAASAECDEGEELDREAWIKGEYPDYDELEALRKLVSEASCSPDWEHGERLIRRDCFADYTQQFAEDINGSRAYSQWPYNCIDWTEAASQLEPDYFTVDFDGVEYLIRS